MSADQYNQRQQTFNDIFGNSRSDEPQYQLPRADQQQFQQQRHLPRVAYQLPRQQHQFYDAQQAPSLQYENVPEQLLSSNLPGDAKQLLESYTAGQSLDPNQYPKTKLEGPYANGYSEQYPQVQQVQQQQQYSEDHDQVAPLFSSNGPRYGYQPRSISGSYIMNNTVDNTPQPRSQSLTSYNSYRSQKDVYGRNPRLNNLQNLESNKHSIAELATNRPARTALTFSNRAVIRTQTSGSRKRAAIYPAMLSKVAKEFRELIVVGERTKNGLKSYSAFNGHEAITVLCSIIRNNDRGLALLLGRALDAQKFFHDVTYEHRLRDSKQEVYQFNEVLTGIPRQDSFSSQSTLVGNNGMDFEDAILALPPTAPMSQQPVEVNGVFTLLSDCYSPTCSKKQLCYLIACPRRLEQQARLNMKPQGGLKRNESKGSVHQDELQRLLWSFSVPKEVLESVDEKEKKRQEIIFETIYTERDFVKDLEYIKDFWIIPLRTKNILPERERELFIRRVFGGINEILMINAKMADELSNRQKQQPVVYQIGDIFINFIPRFHPFVKYAANRTFGKYEFDRQLQTNPQFAKFVQETERMKESRKLDLSSFMSKPTSRPARYPLLLASVLAKTDDDNPDKKNIQKALEMLEKLLAKINKETGYASDRFRLAELKQKLVFKPGEFVDLKLTDDHRQILCESNLTRRNNDEINVYLLDNTLLFVKIKQVNKRKQHKVFQRPIPIQLLYVSMTEEPLSVREIVLKDLSGGLIEPTLHSLSRVNTTSILSETTTLASQTGALALHSPNSQSTGALSTLTENTRTATMSSNLIISSRSNTLKLDLSNNSSLKYPLSFVYVGRRGYVMTLYASKLQEQKKLYEQIERQQLKLKQMHDIFTLTPLTDRFFSSQSNRINCAIPFYGGRRLVCGTDSGIYVSTIRMCVTDNIKLRVVSNPINVIDKPNVTQIEILDDYQTLIVICDKKLICWPLDVLESFNVRENTKKGKELLSHVLFFKVGVCDGKRLVCAAKNGSSHSIKIFEPIDPSKKIAKKKFKSESKEMIFNSEIVSISFLKSKLCIVGCTRGFQVVSIERGSMEALLDAADTSLDFATRREGLKPIAIYKLNSDYLLSYSEFSFFVDVNGWRSRPTWIIHWEGLPQSFALWYPYLLSFDNNFIEIRDCNTSELLRVITGEGIRLLHASSQEILYAYVDANGYDVVASLDFWDKANKRQTDGV